MTLIKATLASIPAYFMSLCDPESGGTSNYESAKGLFVEGQK